MFRSNIQVMQHLLFKAKLRLVILFLASLSAFAQIPGGDSPAGIGVAMTKLFGDTKAFTAKADVQVLDKAQKATMSMPMDFALLDDKIRVEIDMTQMKKKDMPAGATEQIKKMGMAQVISIIRPDRKLIYVIYPDQKCLLTMPLSAEEAEAAVKMPKIEKTAVGKETIDGHACVKNKVVITDDKGQKVEATTWNATDLKDFPVQIQSTEKENTSVVRYKQVQFVKPDVHQFEPPVGYTHYSDQAELMQGLVKKMMSGESK